MILQMMLDFSSYPYGFTDGQKFHMVLLMDKSFLIVLLMDKSFLMVFRCWILVVILMVLLQPQTQQQQPQ